MDSNWLDGKFSHIHTALLFALLVVGRSSAGFLSRSFGLSVLLPGLLALSCEDSRSFVSPVFVFFWGGELRKYRTMFPCQYLTG